MCALERQTLTIRTRGRKHDKHPADSARTPRCEQVLAAASRIAADEFGHDYPGTEHLQLALLADEAAVATQAIQQFVPAREVISELHRIMASEGYNTPRMWPPDR